MKQQLNLPALLPAGLPAVDGIDGYVRYVNAIPSLTKEEEINLTNKLFKTGDLVAAQKLVIAHLKYVVRVAKGYSGYGLAIADLIQEGTVGLMKAVKKFSPDKGVRLVTFAMHWIKAEIHDFIIKNWRIVKIATTKAQRKLFFKLRSSKKQLGWLTNEEVNQIAKDLDVKPKDVLQMEGRLTMPDSPLELPDNDSDKPISTDIYLEDNSSNPQKLFEADNWNSNAVNSLNTALQKLDTRSADILHKRWLDEDNKYTLDQLAKQYGVSKERIRQLEAKAINCLKLSMLELTA